MGLRQACARAAQWPADLKIAVNLSPAQFRSAGPRARRSSTRWQPPACRRDRLELEITESSLLQDSEATLGMLYQLRELGVRIAMDDFGTGYSSLSYLQSFPFDKIKIDRSFVKDIADGVGSLNIVRAVAAMANGLGMTTTAEGVETTSSSRSSGPRAAPRCRASCSAGPCPPTRSTSSCETHRRREPATAAAA